MPEDAAPKASDREQIVQHLKQGRDRILNEWINAVAEDDQIPSADRLTMSALKDHFPDMLEELIQSLQQGQEVMVTRKTGREHGKARWRHGYRLDEVIRELARVRELIVREIVSLAKGRTSTLVHDGVIETVRHFFDTIVATSAQQFAASQEAEVILRTSQLRNAYEQAQAATEQLRVVSESRLRLLRAVVHELRNVLQPISFSALALLEETEPEDRHAIGRQLTKIGGRLQALLDRLRQYSEVLAGEAIARAETFDLGELLQVLDEAHRLQAEQKGLLFECGSSVDFKTITSDRDKLLKIGGNLLDNAISYTSAGSVGLEFVPAGETDRWILRVTDTGSGIDPVEAARIFEDFHARIDAEEPGVHLGLVIARHLAHLVGGEITFQSVVGEGSCFEVNLPRFLEKSSSQPALPPPSPEAPQ